MSKAAIKLNYDISQIRAFVGVTELEYKNLLLKSGTDYAQHLNLHSSELTILLASPTYWAWYTNQFNIIDEAFVQLGVPETPEYMSYSINGIKIVGKYEAWCIMHQPDNMKAYPSEKVLDAANDDFITSKVAEYLNKIVKPV